MFMEGSGISDIMDKSNPESIGQKVRCGLTGPFDATIAACFIIGVALFYAWDLFAIYCGPVISASRYELVPHFPIIVTSTTATLGFASIALFLYKLRGFNTVGFIASLIGGAATIVGLLLANVSTVDPGLIQLVVDGVCRICSCWVIVAWGAQYSRLDAYTITVYTLMSFLLALILCFLFMQSPQIVRVVFVSLALPVSMALLLKASKADFPSSPIVKRDSFIGLTWRIILVFFLFGIVTWTSIPYAQAGSSNAFHMGRLVIIGSSLVVAVLLALATITKGTFSKSYIYKIVLPLIMSGTLLVAIFSFETHVGSALISIGYTCFDLFCFTLFADACRKTGANAKRAFGWCRAIESVTPLVAVLLITFFETFLKTENSMVVNLIGPASVFVVVAIIMLDRTTLFESAQFNFKIDYPQAEVLYFARQCKKAIERFGLSQREAEVLSLVVRGRSVPHIAQRLLISRSTVKTHISHIYTKLDVTDRQEMIDAIESISLDEDEGSDRIEQGYSKNLPL